MHLRACMEAEVLLIASIFLSFTMTYALESSKRKLNRLLDSISSDTTAANEASGETTHNDASTTIKTTGSGLQPPRKRAKIAAATRPEGARRAEALLRNGTLSTIRLSAKAGSESPTTSIARMTKTPLGDTVAPFAPFSRSDFLLRLKTFSLPSPRNWNSKPEAINEIQWAKQGWVLAGKEEVSCSCCSARFMVDYSEPVEELEDDGILTAEARQQLARDAQQASMKKFAAGITEMHTQTCPWRFKGCDGTLTLARMKVNKIDNGLHRNNPQTTCEPPTTRSHRSANSL